MADGALHAASDRGRLPFVMQSEDAECGLACIAMLAGYHGHEVDLASLRRRFDLSSRGTGLAQLIRIAQTLGLDSKALRVELDGLGELQLPCILHWNLNHYVVLRRVGRGWAEVHDPACGVRRIGRAELDASFTGIALELVPSAQFAPIQAVQRISLSALAGPVSGLKRAATQVLGLALGMEILGLLLPFQLKWVMDEVLISADVPLLAVIACAFVLLILVQTGLAIARGWVLSWIGASLGTQWMSNLFGHLLRLPLAYFQKRQVGEIVSRFMSVNSIQTTLTGSFVESVLDGLTGTLALVVLAWYSVALTALVVATFALYALARWLLYRRLWLINQEQLVFSARQQSELVESVRGVQALKLANKQDERRLRFANTTLEAARRNMQRQRFTLAFATLGHGLFGVQRVLLIALGAWMCLRASFSAGLLVAVVAYAEQFASRIGSVVDKIVDFRMLRLHAERIADIALTVPEDLASKGGSSVLPEARIEVVDLSFRYSDSEPWLLRHLNLSIAAGESVAIVGPSGCGKSTLAKLLLGLLEPTEGRILVGGIDIHKFGIAAYRDLAAAVMQDDHLFAGSIADNISFFDPHASLDRIETAARMAAIHADILALPMGYESLVGDMGSALSGGQKQRVILARALYRRPRILVLDEATSHLERACEDLVNAAIASVDATCIVIAHRQETIASADRIVVLREAMAAG